jgi:hypothetical protein
MSHHTFWKALRLLAHPLTLAAVALLLLNDHLFRRLWPSWFTGKLGDFAWLFFAPFALAALLAVLLPGRGRRHAQFVGGLAFGLVGGVFALAKTAPPVHAAVVRWAGAVFGFPVAWQRDPTDLIALASLAAGWWLWRRAQADLRPRPAVGWVVLPLAALLTLANGPAPDPGIYCLDVQERQVVAFSAYARFISSDGGMTWQVSQTGSSAPCPQPWSQPSAGEQMVVDPVNPNVVYRYAPGRAVASSADGGQSWRTEFDLRPASEAEQTYYLKRHGNATFREGPLSGVVDPVTGHALFAMGHAGVLIRRADGQWQWVAVGGYYPMSADRAGAAFSLLIGELVLAVGLGLLALITLALRLGSGWFRKLLCGLGWALWAVQVLVFRPAFMTGYEVLIETVLLVATAVVVIPTAVDAAVRLISVAPAALGRAAAIAAAGMLLFILPYLLWSLNALPSYMLAAVFALVLSAATLFAGFRWTDELLTLPPSNG